jgi:hypothetical protein
LINLPRRDSATTGLGNSRYQPVGDRAEVKISKRPARSPISLQRWAPRGPDPRRHAATRTSPHGESRDRGGELPDRKAPTGGEYLDRRQLTRGGVPDRCQNGREIAVTSGRPRAARTTTDVGTRRLTCCLARMISRRRRAHRHSSSRYPEEEQEEKHDGIEGDRRAVSARNRSVSARNQD